MPIIKGSFGNRAEKLSELKNLLANKYQAQKQKLNGILPTGLDAIDKLEGGLRKGAITELIGSCSAGALFVEAIKSKLEHEHYFAALIDSTNSFSPEIENTIGLNRLLWVICENPKQAIKVADLLLRDANLPLVILDLNFAEPKQLRGIQVSTWHRFQRLIEQSNTALIVLSNQPVVEGAQAKITVNTRWRLQAMRQRRSKLLSNIDAHISLRHHYLNTNQHTSQ